MILVTLISERYDGLIWYIVHIDHHGNLIRGALPGLIIVSMAIDRN